LLEAELAVAVIETAEAEPVVYYIMVQKHQKHQMDLHSYLIMLILMQ
jgi:hypothetical protein